MTKCHFVINTNDIIVFNQCHKSLCRVEIETTIMPVLLYSVSNAHTQNCECEECLCVREWTGDTAHICARMEQRHCFYGQPVAPDNDSAVFKGPNCGKAARELVNEGMGEWVYE